MAADLFLTCFLACMFAFITFGLIAWQISRWWTRRAIARHLPGLMTTVLQSPPGMMDGMMDEETRQAMEELVRNARSTPPGVTPHLSAVCCSGCGARQEVPLTVGLPEFLGPLGWEFEEGWACRSCAGRADPPPLP